MQIRTEEIGLYGHLNSIERTEDPWYGCDQAYQLVRHTIEDCERLEDTRFTYLGKNIIGDARPFLRDTEPIPKTVKFMLANGLLDQFANYAKTLSLLE
jgi:hypothetical protein